MRRKKEPRESSKNHRVVDELVDFFAHNLCLWIFCFFFRRIYVSFFSQILRCSNARQIRQSTEGDQMGSSVLDVGIHPGLHVELLMSLVNLVNSDGSLNCLQMMRKSMRTDLFLTQ